VQDKINVVDLGQACSMNVVSIDEYCQLIKILT